MCPEGADEAGTQWLIKHITRYSSHTPNIELDGSQHYDDTGIAQNRERDAFPAAQGMTVIRYSNLDVTQRFRSVCDDILLHLESN